VACRRRGERPPRPPDEPLLGSFLTLRTFLVGALMTAGAVGLFLYEYNLDLEAGTPPELALAESQTVAVTTIILFQCAYLLNCRSLTESVFRIGLDHTRAGRAAGAVVGEAVLATARQVRARRRRRSATVGSDTTIMNARCRHLADNLLYPIVVGKNLCLHTVPLLVALIGGVVVFGAVGFLLGPVVLAVTLAALEATPGNPHRESHTADFWRLTLR